MLHDILPRLERAKEPDRELDADIYEAVFGVTGRCRGEIIYGARFSTDVASGTPEYTGSIDAALLLLPPDQKDWREYSATIWAGKHSAARIFYRQVDPEAEGGWSIGSTSPLSINAATPAIALCIAALKARGVVS